MASNSNGTITPTLVAQKALEIMVDVFPMVTAFSSDFSAEGVYYGQTINTRYASLTQVQNYDTVNGYVPASGILNNVALTINQHRHASIAFNDQELSSSNLNLIEQHAAELAGTIGADIMSGISTLFTTGNFSSTVSLATGVLATRASVPVAAKKQLDTNKITTVGRTLITNPNIQSELLQDQYIFGLLYGGKGNAAGDVPNLVDFTIAEYSALPSTANLVTVAAQRDAVVVAARVPSDPTSWVTDIPVPAKITNVVDPKTGFTIQVRESYNPALGQIQVSYVYMLGYAVGNPKAAVLFTRVGG